MINVLTKMFAFSEKPALFLRKNQIFDLLQLKQISLYVGKLQVNCTSYNLKRGVSNLEKNCSFSDILISKKNLFSLSQNSKYLENLKLWANQHLGVPCQVLFSQKIINIRFIYFSSSKLFCCRSQFLYNIKDFC